MTLTAVLGNADDIWQVQAAALAETPTMKSIRAELKKDAIVPPGLSGVAKSDPRREGRRSTSSRTASPTRRCGAPTSAAAATRS